MSDKEINPLKRGRVQNKSRSPKKSPTVGEISDPASVLNDSISQGRTTKKINNEPIEKTTTVDDPLCDPIEQELSTEKPSRSEQNGRGERRCRTERNRRDSKFSAQNKETTCSCDKCDKLLCTIKHWLRKIACHLGFKCKESSKSKCSCGKKSDNRYHRRGNGSRRPRSTQK